jgi:hypothetical protein
MPKSMEEQAREAERLLRQQYPENYTEEELKEVGFKPVFDEEGNLVGVEQISGEQKPDGEPKPDGEGEPKPDDESKPDGGEPKPDVKKEPTDEEYKQKYFVLKGKYDAEVPRLQAELKELKDSVAELKAVKPKETPAPDKTEDDLLSDPSIKYLHDEYPEVYKAVLAIEKKKVVKSDDKSGTELSERIAKIEKSQTRTIEERFGDDLNRLAPDWEKINEDPKFLEWLKEEDQFTGYTRFQLATSAQNDMNGPRVAAFYNAFKKDIYPEVKNDDPNNGESKKDMSKFVAPNASKSGSNREPNKESEPITREYINKFYSDAAKGVYEGRKEAYDKIEALITKALSEGKIE